MRPVIYPIAGLGAGQLSIMARPSGGLDLEGALRGLKHRGVDHVVSLLEPEEAEDLWLGDEGAVCGSLGLRFTSFPITDFDVPLYRDAVLELVETLHFEIANGAHVVAHCRAGIGRSGLIACALLVRDGMTPDAAMETATLARGVPVPITREQVAWVESLGGRDWVKGKD
jgi:predicted protein tyrosine phosphatase